MGAVTSGAQTDIRMQKNLRRYIRLLGIIVFGIILWRIDLRSLVNILRNARLEYLAGGLLLVLVILAIKSLRWRYLMHLQGINFSYWDTFLMFSAGIFWGVLTPARVGELSKALYLTKRGYSLGKASVSVVYDRLIDIFVLLLIGYGSMLAFLSVIERKTTYLIIILGLLAGIVIGLFLHPGSRERLRRLLFQILMPKTGHVKLKLNIDEFFESLKDYKLRHMTYPFALTALSRSVYFSITFLFAKSLSIPISFFYNVVCVSFSTFMALLPISVAGLGTRDATLILLFSLVGLSKERAVGFAATILLMSVAAGTIGFFAWLKKPYA